MSEPMRPHALVLDVAEFEGPVAFWTAALGYVEWFPGHGQFAGIKPPVLDGRLAIIFQKVPEPKVVKNRMHVDFEHADMPAEVERLKALGAREVAERSLGPGSRWTVMEDPFGNEFCVAQAR